MNKRAISQDWFMWGFVKIPFWIICALTIAIMINSGEKIFTQTQEVSLGNIQNQVYFSPSINKVDPYLHRSIPGVIDLSKIETANLENEFSYDTKPPLAMKIIVFDTNNIELSSFTYPDTRNYLSFTTTANKKGRGATTQIKNILPITLNQKSLLQKATIEYDLLVKNK